MPLLATCAFPTDQSSGLFVTIEASSSVLVRGQTLVLRARTWQRTAQGDRVGLAKASVAWSSDPSGIVTVAGREDGSAVVTGINVGRVQIRAVPLDYQKGDPGVVDLRVANTVEIDSVRPDTVSYGDQLTLYGVGLGRISSVALGQTNLIADTNSLSGDSAGEGQQRFWVPYPAASGKVLAVAVEGPSAPASDSTIVLPRSTYTESDSVPAIIDLNGPAIAPGAVLFHNPALAITSELTPATFRFVRADTTRPVTIAISTTAPVIQSLRPTFARAGDLQRELFDTPSWKLGTSYQFCSGVYVRTSSVLDFGTNPVTITRSFDHLPALGLDLAVSGVSPGRYSLTVHDGYAGSDPRILPDRFEENDYCLAADANFQDPARRIDLATVFADTLTIDQPYEVDWFRLSVPPADAEGQLLTIRTAARPFGATDSSDIGLVLFRVDSLETFLDTLSNVDAESHATGSDESLVTDVTPGDYYLVVVDEAGVPTRYSLCVAIGNACALPASEVRRARWP